MEWIDVTKELPPKGQNVLCYSGDEYFPITVASYRADPDGHAYWSGYDQVMDLYEFTHWKFLDAPPAAIRESKESK